MMHKEVRIVIGLVLAWGWVGVTMGWAAPQAAPSGVSIKRFGGIPVEMATGELIQRERADVKLKSRGLPLEVSRNYRSRREGMSVFGYGWSWNHVERLEFPGDRVINYVTPDGTVSVYPDVSYTGGYARVCLNSGSWEHGASATGAPDATGGYGNVAHFYGPIASLTPLVVGGWAFQAPEGPSSILQVDLISIGATAYDHDHPQYGVGLNLSAGGSHAVSWGHRAYDYDGVTVTSDRASWSWEDVNSLQARISLDTYVQNTAMDVVVDSVYLGVTYTRNADGQFKYLPGTTFELLRTNNEYWVLNRNLTQLAFSMEGRLLRKIDSNGNTLTFHYDGVGRPQHIADDAGQALTLVYEHDRLDAKVVLVRDSTGRSTGYAYEGDDLVAVTNVMGGVVRYAYDSGHAEADLKHNLIRRTDPEGVAVSCAYYASNAMTDRVWKYWDGEMAEGRSNEVDYLYLNGTTYSFVPGAGTVQGVVYTVSNDISQVYVREGELTYQTTDGLNLMAQHAAGRVSSPSTSLWENLVCAAGETNGIDAHTAWLTPSNALEAADWHFDVPGLSNDIVKVKLTVRGTALSPVWLSAGGMMGTNWVSTNEASVTVDITGDHAQWTWADISNLTATVAVPRGLTNAGEVRVDGFLVSVAYRHFDPGREASDFFYYYDLAHNLVSSDRGGAVHRFAYDSRGNLESWTDPEGNVRRYDYEPRLNKPVRTRDARGHQTQLSYDERGRLIKTTDALGRSETMQYDAFGNCITRTFPDGSVEVSGYDAKGVNRITMRNRRGYEWTYDYDARGNCVRETTPLGGHRQSDYDAAGRKIRDWDEIGVETRFAYDGNGRLTNLITAAGTDDQAVERHGYDGLGRETQAYDPLGHRRDWGFDVYGRLIYEVDPLGGLMITDYDEHDHPLRRYDPMGAYWETVCDPRGNVVIAYDRRGFSHCATYNGNDQPVSEVDRMGNRVETRYDGNGNMTSQTFYAVGYPGCIRQEIPEPVTTVYDYDGLNRVTNTTVVTRQGKPRRTQQYYDLAGHRVRETDPLGQSRISECDAHGNVTNHLVVEAGGRVSAQTRSTYDAADRLILEIREGGARAATNYFAYDARGLKTMEVDAEGRQYRYGYDRNRRRIATIRPDGTVQEKGYDPAGRLVRERETEGAELRYEYDASGHLIRRIGGAGRADQRTTCFDYDASGRLVRQIDALGGVTGWAYDDEGNCVAETNSLGWVKAYFLNAAGRVTNTVDEAGQSTIQFLDGRGKLCRWVDRLGRVSLSRYDAFGNLTALADPLGNVSRWDYDPLDRRVSETNPNGLTTRYAYNAAGQMTQRTVGAGLPTARLFEFVYDELGHPVQKHRPDGAVVSMQYDAVGNLIALTNELGAVTRYEYDAMNRCVRVVDAWGGQSRTEYDARGNRVAAIDAEGNRTRYYYDPYNAITREVDPLGGVTRYEYDALGRLTTTTDALGHQESRSFDAAGHRLATVDKNGAVTRFEYDRLGRETGAIDALGVRTFKVYDAVGNIVAESDKCGSISVTRYDALNRPIAMMDAASNTVTFSYDACGNRIREQGQSGAITTSAYDLFGQLRVKTVGAGTALMRRTRYEYDPMGRVISEEDHLGAAILTRYDRAGNKVSLTDRRGHVTRMEYDPLNRLVCTTDALGKRSTVEYDRAGRIVASVNRRGDVTRHTYNAAGLLIEQRDAKGQVRQKHYDAMRRCREEMAPNGGVTAYEYDAAGNMTNQIAGSGTERPRRQGFAYDALGRRIRETDALGGAVAYSYDGNGNVVTASSYSADGRLLRMKRTDYDYRNLPVRVYDYLGHQWQTGYDVMGRKRVEVDPLGNTTTYDYDVLGQLTVVTDPAGAKTRTRYDGNGQPIETINALGERRRIFRDANGNPRAVTDDQGRAILTSRDALNRSVRVQSSMPSLSLDTLRRADLNADGVIDEDDVVALEARLP